MIAAIKNSVQMFEIEGRGREARTKNSQKYNVGTRSY